MLEGRNIILRPLKITDWEKTLQWRNDITIKKLAMMHPFPITEINEREWYEKMVGSTDNRFVYFTITDKVDKPVGFIMLKNINYIHKNCMLGLIIGDESDRGKGYGREAMELMMAYTFDTLNINKITIEALCSNANAIAMYSKLGFIEEGRLRQQYYVDGEYLDVILMSVFRQQK